MSRNGKANSQGLKANGALLKRPSLGTQQLMRGAANSALREGLAYSDAVDIFRRTLIDSAVKQSPRGKTGAAAVLAISRRFVQKTQRGGLLR